MNITILKEAGINYEEGIKRFAHKQELYEKYLVKFFDDPSFAQLGDCISKKNYTEAFKCAHTLKGTSGNLSLTEFYECDCILVEALRNNQTGNITDLYNALASSYERLKSAVTD